MKLFVALLSMLLMFETFSQRDQRRFEINMNDQVYQGNQTIPLKREIKRLYPRVNLRNFDLQRVVVFAKSARGYGELTLVSGNRESVPELVEGNRRDFRRRGFYHRIVLRSPGFEEVAPWQIKTQGRIKIDRLIVVARRRGAMGGGFPGTPDRGVVTRSCTYVLELVFGRDLRRYTATATGRRGSGVRARACRDAFYQCQSAAEIVPLSQCNQVGN